MGLLFIDGCVPPIDLFENTNNIKCKDTKVKSVFIFHLLSFSELNKPSLKWYRETTRAEPEAYVDCDLAAIRGGNRRDCRCVRCSRRPGGGCDRDGCKYRTGSHRRRRERP